MSSHIRIILTLVFGTLAAIPAALPAAAKPEVRVYLMRGFADVSTGLDELADKLKSRKIHAEITTYLAESDVAARALHDYKANPGSKVVLIGHSLGANAAIHVAKSLQAEKVPVALIVVFSPAAANDVPGNVGKAVNYFQSDGIWNNPYSRGAGFHGTLRNVDLAKETQLHHLNLEKVPSLHAATIRDITGLASSPPPAQATKPDAPAAAAGKN